MAEISQSLTIGQFSTLSRISVRMLRHYDAHGVLSPRSVDRVTGYRSYAREQITDADQVRRLRDAGFGVSAIASLMKNHDADLLREALEERREALEGELAVLHGRIETVTALLRDTNMSENSAPDQAVNFVVTSHVEPPQVVVGLRGIIPHYWDEHLLWSQLEPLLREKGIEPSGPCGATMFDEGYKERDVDVEAWIPVSSAVDVEAPLLCHTIPEQKVLSVRVQGPFRLIGPACGVLAAHVAQHDVTPSGRMFNRYLVAPEDGVPESDYVTDVCLPIH